MDAAVPPATDHPAPQRRNAGLWALAYGLGAAPLAWASQSIAGYALSSQSCNAADTARASAQLAHSWPLLLSFNLAALVISASAIGVSWRSWHATRREREGTAATLMQVGEGRTRFLAMCGLLSSGAFATATVFTAVALLLLPLCR